MYGGALGRVKLRTTPGTLVGLKGYCQRLSLADATLVTDVATDSGPLAVRCWIPAQTDALIIECQDDRQGVAERALEIETWRDSAETVAEQAELLVTDHLRTGREPDYRFAIAAGVDGAAAVAERTDPRCRGCASPRAASPSGWP